jgi:hypothetical protein
MGNYSHSIIYAPPKPLISRARLDRAIRNTIENSIMSAHKNSIASAWARVDSRRKLH